MGSSPQSAQQLLDGLTHALRATDLGVVRESNALIVKHRHFSTRMEMIPLDDDADSAPDRAALAVQIRTDLPQEVGVLLNSAKSAAAANRMASLGALTIENERVFIGSRLTICEPDKAWNLHGPLILNAVIFGADSLLSAFVGALNGQGGSSAESVWQEQDFETIEALFSDRCVCTAGAEGFSAEFGLRPGEVSAMAQDSRTALWSLDRDQAHPTAGAGLFCLLQMPHQIVDESRLAPLLAQLNRLEMQASDLPPHFGAWCPGKLGCNPAYISFLPNALHDAAPGIAVNMTAWAWARAQWAHITLASLGVSAE